MIDMTRSEYLQDIADTFQRHFETNSFWDLEIDEAKNFNHYFSVYNIERIAAKGNILQKIGKKKDASMKAEKF